MFYSSIVNISEYDKYIIKYIFENIIHNIKNIYESMNLLVFENTLQLKNINSTSINIYSDNNNIYFLSNDDITKKIIFHSTDVSFIKENIGPTLILKGLTSGNDIILRDTPTAIFIDTFPLDILMVSSLNMTPENNIVYNGVGPNIVLKYVRHTLEKLRLSGSYGNINVRIEDMWRKYNELYYKPDLLDYIPFGVGTTYSVPNISAYTNIKYPSGFESKKSLNGWLQFDNSSQINIYLINVTITLQSNRDILVTLTRKHTYFTVTVVYYNSIKHTSINSQVETYTFNDLISVSDLGGDEYYLSFLSDAAAICNIHYLQMSVKLLKEIPP